MSGTAHSAPGSTALWWNDVQVLRNHETAPEAAHSDGTESEWWTYQPVLTRPEASSHILVVLADQVGHLDKPPLDEASVHTLNMITVWIRIGYTVHILSPYRPHTSGQGVPAKLRQIKHSRTLYHSIDVVLRQVVPGNLSLRSVWMSDRTAADSSMCDPQFFTTAVKHLCHKHRIGQVFVRDSTSSHPKHRYAESLLKSDIQSAATVIVCGMNPFSQGTMSDPSALVRSYGAVPVTMVSDQPKDGFWMPPLVRETLETSGRTLPRSDVLRVVYSGSAHSEYIWWLPRLALALLQLRESRGACVKLCVVIHQKTRSPTFAQMEASLRALPFIEWHFEPSLNQRLKIYERCDLGVMLSSSSRLSPQHHERVAARSLEPHLQLYPQKDVLQLRQLAAKRMGRLSAEYALPATLVEMGSRGMPVILDRTPAHQRVAGHSYPLYLRDSNIRSFRELVDETLDLGFTVKSHSTSSVYQTASQQLLQRIRADFTIDSHIGRLSSRACQKQGPVPTAAAAPTAPVFPVAPV